MVNQTIQQVAKVDFSGFQQKEFSDDNLDQLGTGSIGLMYQFLFPMFSSQDLYKEPAQITLCRHILREILQYG